MHPIIHHFSNFLFIKFLQREAQSHNGLLDYICEVGAPTKLVADNSKTQNGKKWTNTCRIYAIEQGNTVPDNQNQNCAERKIQVVKAKSGAPLSFWCYGMAYIVDCLNHSAAKSLQWRMPMEVHHGDTRDISMFRFHFWQPVEVYSQRPKFPASKLIPARFIGIAWNSGNAFTYRVWTEPDEEGWTNGKELIRNFVQP